MMKVRISLEKLGPSFMRYTKPEYRAMQENAAKGRGMNVIGEKRVRKMGEGIK